MTDPDLSIGSPEDRAHRDQIDADAMTAAKLREALNRVEAHDGTPSESFVFEMRNDLAKAYGDRYSEIGGLVELACRGGIEALGAVVALVKREMPGLSWNIEKRQIGPIYVARIWDGPIDGWDCFVKTSPALALLAAFLRALIAEAEQAGQRAGKAS